ncbi:MAG: NupC/NupG family nucleoside CNT transporter [Planctomycetes bacterium]|nr:NupC/NupG family nucleoside CNT transporter [Planctomycetota bacterium]
MERWISGFGLVAMIGLAWLMSSHKRRISWRVVVGGALLQFAFALLVLRTEPGHWFFAFLGDVFTRLLAFVDEGSLFVFGVSPRGGESGFPPGVVLLRTFAFGVLPTIVFFSSLMSVLYHLGVMQKVVLVAAWIMQKTLGTSGAESLSAAANIFVGQTEAPLMIRPYVGSMTQSELMAVMVGGFATIAGGVMAAYVAMGIDAGHLMTASVISAPAALLIAKVMQPETEQPKTLGRVAITVERTSVNVIDAAAVGALDGMKLAINVAAMLIAFLALLAMFDWMIAWVGHQVGTACGLQLHWSLSKILGYLFWPLAWLMGIEPKDCLPAGQLMGLKMAANEFVAYQRLTEWLQPASGVRLSPRTVTILTYALCGFANFGSIGIQLGGIGGIAPERRGDLARLGLRAMLGGTLAACMTACIAGVLL